MNSAALAARAATVHAEHRVARVLLGITQAFIVLQVVIAIAAPTVLKTVCGGWGMTPAWLLLGYTLLAIAARMARPIELSTRRSTGIRVLAFAALGLAAYELLAHVWNWQTALHEPLLDLTIPGRSCPAEKGPSVAGVAMVLALALTVIFLRSDRQVLKRLRDVALAGATAIAMSLSVAHLIAGSGFGTFMPAPSTNAFASLMLLLIACAMGLYRSGPSPYQWLVQHAHRRALTRVIMILVLFPAAVLIGDSFLAQFGIEEQVSETAAIAAATVFVAASVARFSMREEAETQKRLELAAELVRSEAHYRLLAENSVDVVAKFDAANRMDWVSPSVTAMLGWEPWELIGKSAEDLAHPDDLPAALHGRQQMHQSGVTSYRVRIVCKDGTYKWIGVRGRVVRDELGKAVGVSASLRDIDHEVHVEQRLDRLARSDSLTGLMNRTEVYERIQDLSERQDAPTSMAILFCDMDNLKELNDEHGHAAGDAVLRELGARIQRAVRSADLVARIGGDEFLVVLTSADDAQEVLLLAERVRKVAAEPIEFDGVSLSTTLSIGVTIASPSESVETAVARADHAMYLAKRDGRNRVLLAAQTDR